MSDTLTAKGNKLVGYALTFNTPSTDLGGFTETIAPDALDRTKAEQPDLRALVDHDPRLLIGRNSSGTLRYAVDSHGLKVNISPPNTQAGHDIVELVGRRDVTGMSFSFVTFVDDWEQKGAKMIRTLRDIRLREVSAVSFPAYLSSSVTVDGSRAACRSRAETAMVEQWNSSWAPSPETRAWRQARLAQAADVAKGRTRCVRCQKGIAVAVRAAVAMCGPCLAAGDAARQQEFRAVRRNQPHGQHSRTWWETLHRQRLAQ
jgi:HK97 family phage prohead protease